MGNITVRQYREKDKAACRELWVELTQWHRDIYQDQNIGGPHLGRHFDEHLKKAGPEHLLVAVDGRKIVGLTGYLVMDEEVEVEPLVVAASHRGKGIGTLLLDSLIERARGTGIKYLNVRPVARNKKALEFFRKRGFDKIGRIELFVDCTGKEWKKGLKLFDSDFGY